MLIGEAPGEVEDREGKPFIGSAGSVLDGLLADVGLKRADVYISNVVKCRPPGNRDPLPAELSACWSYLAEELASVKPKVIICAGRYPLQVLTGRKTIKDERGKPVPASRHVRIGDAAILATYHPAAALHNRRQDSSGNSLILSAIREDLELAKALAGLTTQVLPEHERIMLLPREYGTKADDVIAALMRLRVAKTIAVDCEWTAGKDEDEGMFWPWTPGAELYSLSLSGRASGKVVSIGVAWPQEPRAQRALQAFMTARKLVFHNAMADLIWLVATGILTLVDLIKLARSGALDDTQFMGYLLNEEQRLNLDRLAPLIAGIPPGWKRGPWTRRPASERGWTHPEDGILPYNQDDTYATLLLREGLVRQVAAKAKDERANIGKAYRKLLIPALPTFVSMALNGAPIDSAELDKAIEEQQATAERVAVEAASDMNRPVAVAKQILASHDKIRRHLVEAYGLRLSDARADTLEPYARQFPVVKARTDYTHAKKMTGTYLEPWQTLVRRQGDNALHSIYRLDRTRTGRTSANTEIGGSIQLAPRAEWFRRMIGTVEDDWELISADYSQAEIRTTAWLAPERTMRRLYNEGADLHLRTAMEVAQDETVRTAQMLLLRAGLPTSRASSEILSEVFRITDGDRETQEKGKVLSTGGNVWSDKESWRRLWRQSKWREEPVLEGRHISAFLHDSPEGLLREVWSEDKSSSSPQRPQSSEQRRIEYRDAVPLVSRAGARVLQAFPEWKEHRQRAKGVGFGFLFGMQAEKFQQYAYTSYGVTFTLDESIEAREKFFNLYSDLAAWHERAKQQMFSGEPISMPFGRYRRGATDVTQYINTPIQTTANDLAIFATSKIGDKVLAEYSGVAKMAGYVHDSIFVKVRRDYTDEIKALVKDMMEHPPLDEVGIEIPVPLVADVKVGRNWADAK